VCRRGGARPAGPTQSPLYWCAANVASHGVQIADQHPALKLGPARIGIRIRVTISTVHRVRTRLGVSCQTWMVRPPELVTDRYEPDHPGEPVHVDHKELGRIPDQGGWRVLERQAGIGKSDT